MRVAASLITLVLTGWSIWSAFTLYGAYAPADKKPVHIFILSGQSNMAGMDPKLGFEPESKKLFPDAEVVYLKVSRGGQPIRHWVSQWDEIAKKHGIDVKAVRSKDKVKTSSNQDDQPTLEFAILANERDHGVLIDAAKDVENVVKVDGVVKARWVPEAPGNQKADVGIQSHGRIVVRERKVKKSTIREFLIVQEKEKFRITNQHMEKVYQVSPNGSPAIGFELDKTGGYLLQNLTSSNRPANDGFRRRMGIIINGYLHSAPNLNGVISNTGVIEGNFSKGEIQSLIASIRTAKNKITSANIAGTVYYKPILDQYAKLIEKHPNPTSVTFCWMQGERDAKEKLDAAYKDSLKQLIANLRKDLKQPNMNFVIGRLSDFGKPDYKEWQNVRKVQVEIAEEDKLGSWGDCDDLNNKTKNGTTRDDLHYTKEGYELLGRRYARQAKLLIDGEKPAANGRPE